MCSLFVRGSLTDKKNLKFRKIFVCTSLKIAETSKIVLRSVQHIIKKCKDSGEPLSSKKNVVGKKKP